MNSQSTFAKQEIISDKHFNTINTYVSKKSLFIHMAKVTGAFYYNMLIET